MDKLLDALSKLIPVGVAIGIVAFIYLVILFKRTSDRFIQLSEKQADFLRERIDVLDKTSVIFTRTIEQQEREIKKLRTELDSVNTVVTQTRSTITDRSIEEFKAISGAVQQVLKLQAATLDFISSEPGADTAASRPASLLKRNMEISEALKVEIPRLVGKRDLSRYPVEIVPLEAADRLLSTLRASGFSASLYADPFDTSHLIRSEQHEAIWVGKRVPPDVAISAIDAAVRQWPFLKYIHISGDLSDDPPPNVHDMLFFGGATSTALSYKLRPWEMSEIRRIPTTNLSEFHTAIRSHYDNRSG